MFNKLCPWCGSNEGIFKSIGRSNIPFRCFWCNNLFKKRFGLALVAPFVVLLLLIVIPVFESLQTVFNEENIILVSFVFVLYYFITVSTLPKIRHYGVFDNVANTEKTYLLTKLKVEINWIPRPSGGLFLPKLLVFRADVFAIEKANGKVADDKDHATFVILKKFTSMRRDEAIFEHLLSYSLDDEFYLMYKDRKIAKCTVKERYTVEE